MPHLLTLKPSERKASKTESGANAPPAKKPKRPTIKELTTLFERSHMKDLHINILVPLPDEATLEDAQAIADWISRRTLTQDVTMVPVPQVYGRVQSITFAGHSYLHPGGELVT